MSTVDDPRLGPLKIHRTENHGHFVWCSWVGRIMLPGRRWATAVDVTGNDGGPHRTHLDEVCRVVDNLDAIAARVDAELNRRSISTSFDRFHISSIGIWDEHDDILSVDCVPIGRPVLEERLEIYWPGDDWALDHHVVLEAKDYFGVTGA